MTDTMPSPRLEAARLAEIRALYPEGLGFVPPRIEARVAVGSRLDPDGLGNRRSCASTSWIPPAST